MDWIVQAVYVMQDGTVDWGLQVVSHQIHQCKMTYALIAITAQKDLLSQNLVILANTALLTDWVHQQDSVMLDGFVVENHQQVSRKMEMEDSSVLLATIVSSDHMHQSPV